MTLDLTASRDRRGLWAYRDYNANQQLESIKDPANRTTSYGWCSCGALESITDAKNQTTLFQRDLQGRVYQKVFADNTTIDYLYEGQGAPNTPGATSRLKSSTDAKSQRTNYLYYADDSVQQVSYTNTTGQPLNPPTPSVSYTYDPNYSRAATMGDGTGTTAYAYHPVGSPPVLGAGQLSSVDGPLADDTITFSYDQLGRRLSESLNSAAASRTYDSLGRISTVTNPLGPFTHSYDGVTQRLQSTAFPNGQSTTYSYHPNAGDRRLQTITNLVPGGALLSKFDYAYDAEGQITLFTRQLEATGYPMTWSGSGGGSMYDAADQLTNVLERAADDMYGTRSYSYDVAGNVASSAGATFNSVNQRTGAGQRSDLNGNLVADSGRTYEWDAANRLMAINLIGIGTRSEFTYNGLGHRVKIVEKQRGSAVWSAGFQPGDANYFTYSIPLGLAAGDYTLEFRGLNPYGGDNTALLDNVTLNGSQIWNGGFESPVLAAGTFSYQPSGGSWAFVGDSGISTGAGAFSVNNPAPPEGAQVAFLQGTGSMSQAISFPTASNTLNVTAAQRAGNAQQVLASLYSWSSFSVTQVKQFIWIGDRIAEQRDANNNLTRRYYPEGEQWIGIADGYYTRDHLGSIREVIVGGSNLLAARYDYDPFGYRRKVAGDFDVDWGFTGNYYHAPSGLHLAPYRAYDATAGRWISRDPIAERGRLNLYAYVGNQPLRLVDPLGLDSYMMDVSDTMYGFINGYFDVFDWLPDDACEEEFISGAVSGSGLTGCLGSKGWPRPASKPDWELWLSCLARSQVGSNFGALKGGKMPVETSGKEISYIKTIGTSPTNVAIKSKRSTFTEIKFGPAVQRTRTND